MKPHIPKRHQHLLQLIIFYLLLIAVIVVAARFTLATNTQFDWTAAQRYSLSAETQDLLRNLNETIDIEVFISPEHQYAGEIKKNLQRYQQHTDKLVVSYTDPASAPQRVKQLLIQQQGEMHIRSASQFERVMDLSEHSLSNALYRVTRSDTPLLMFVQGHGERLPDSEANFGLSQWAGHLTSKGFEIAKLYPARTPNISDNVDLLIIASSERPWLAGEIELVKAYVNRGGNLLWMVEPDSNQYLGELAAALNIKVLPGMVIDPNVAKLGIDDPRFVLISDYANHPLVQASSGVSLLPTATALQSLEQQDWQVTDLLRSQPDSWLTLSAVDDANGQSIAFDETLDIPGPLTLGMLLERSTSESSQQRVAVLGDGDFVANTYLGNAANLDLSIALVEWLTQQEDILTIPPKRSQDRQLDLSIQQSLVIALGFLIVLPGILLLSGLIIWWHRRRR